MVPKIHFMTKRLDFIRKLKKEKEMREILTMKEAIEQEIVKLGKNVKIKEGTVIGTDGFGYERNEKNELEKFPHFGNVIIQDYVDIGANCTIDRGNMHDTIIGKGTKIDNGVHIAHNVKIGKHCMIGPHSVLLGSCEVEDYTTIWTNVIVKEHVKIGSKVVVGACSYVNHDVPSDTKVWGIPAKIDGRNSID